jgi:hypothetical protein
MLTPWFPQGFEKEQKEQKGAKRSDAVNLFMYL